MVHLLVLLSILFCVCMYVNTVYFVYCLENRDVPTPPQVCIVVVANTRCVILGDSAQCNSQVNFGFFTPLKLHHAHSYYGCGLLHKLRTCLTHLEYQHGVGEREGSEELQVERPGS